MLLLLVGTLWAFSQEKHFLELPKDGKKYKTLETGQITSPIMTEYKDGHLWAYRQIGDFVVGMTNYNERNKYGNYYQIQVFVNNIGKKPVTFDPGQIKAAVYDKKGRAKAMSVYTYNDYISKIEGVQIGTMIAYAILAGQEDTYNHNYLTTASQMSLMNRMMDDDKRNLSLGYLRITTIHPNEGIVGFMNIKRKKGKEMSVRIPVNGVTFNFDWDLPE